MPLEIQKGEFSLSTEAQRLDIDAIYNFLSQTYWARYRSREVVERSIHNSLCFGIYKGASQVGFGRAVTDRATYAYIADVYILEPYRGRGLARWLIQSMLSHPELEKIRRWSLLTPDAHDLYRP